MQLHVRSCSRAVYLGQIYLRERGALKQCVDAMHATEGSHLIGGWMVVVVGVIWVRCKIKTRLLLVVK